MLLSIAVTAVWMVIELFVIGKHEIWQDEAHHWLLGWHSDSFSDLLFNMRYEGHPPLWNILLFAVTKCTDSIFAMQLMHLCFAAGSVFLIIRYAPFPLWVKLILPFTYFFGYEYAIIARNYAPGIFFLVLACCWLGDSQRNLVKIALALGVASLFHIYIALVAIPFFAYVVWQNRSGLHSRRIVISALCLLVLVLLAGWFVLRVPGDHFAYGLKYHEARGMSRCGTALLLPFTSLVHFPDLIHYNWWNSNIFLPENDYVKAGIGIVFWFVPVLALRNNRSVMRLYLIGVVIISAVLFVTPMPLSLRHSGMIVELFFVCLWLDGGKIATAKTGRIIVVIILGVQFSAYAATFYKELTAPLSNSKPAVDYINQNYNGLHVAVEPQFMGPPICAYLGKPVYYPKRDTTGTFADWSNAGFGGMPDEMIDRCSNYLERIDADSMVFITVHGEYEFHRSDVLYLRKSLTGASLASEDYDIYILKRK